MHASFQCHPKQSSPRNQTSRTNGIPGSSRESIPEVKDRFLQTQPEPKQPLQESFLRDTRAEKEKQEFLQRSIEAREVDEEDGSQANQGSMLNDPSSFMPLMDPRLQAERWTTQEWKTIPVQQCDGGNFKASSRMSMQPVPADRASQNSSTMR